MILEYDLQFFAAEGQGGEKTEPATEKKLSDARKEGQVAKSREIANGQLCIRDSTKYWFSTMQENHDEHYEEYIESMIRRVDIPIKAVLGRSTISVNDFLNLQVGDCIRLDSRVDTDMNVYVGNIKKFTALPGTDRDSYAVQITSVIREEE